jgi:hypothetical protein
MRMRAVVLDADEEIRLGSLRIEQLSNSAET